MESGPINLDQLWDADSYVADGGSPFSVLSYPSESADKLGLPNDAEAQDFLAELQRRGFRIGVWKYPNDDRRIVYVGVDADSIKPIMSALSQMKATGKLTTDFLERFMERTWPQI